MTGKNSVVRSETIPFSVLRDHSQRYSVTIYGTRNHNGVSHEQEKHLKISFNVFERIHLRAQKYFRILEHIHDVFEALNLTLVLYNPHTTTRDGHGVSPITTVLRSKYRSEHQTFRPLKKYNKVL